MQRGGYAQPHHQGAASAAAGSSAQELVRAALCTREIQQVWRASCAAPCLPGAADLDRARVARAALGEVAPALACARHSTAQHTGKMVA